MKPGKNIAIMVGLSLVITVAVVVYAIGLHGENAQLGAELVVANDTIADYRHRYEQAQLELGEEQIVHGEEEIEFHFWRTPIKDRQAQVIDDIQNRPELAGWEGRHGLVFINVRHVEARHPGVNGFVLVTSDDGYNDMLQVFYYEILQNDGSFLFTNDMENDGEIVWTHVATLFDRLNHE